METIKFYTLDEVKDKHIGKVGTPHRDKYEAELQSFLIGEAIKKARKSQNMTQEELAQKIGVQRAQVSKIESGRNLTLSTVARVFRAMGMEASLSIAGFGSITRRCVLRSGNNSNANSGLAYANANNASSNSNTNYGARLKFCWLN